MIELPDPPLETAVLREAFGCYPSGVTAVCGVRGDKPVGMAANSFASVSLDPPLVSVCMQNTSRTWQELRTLRRLGVSVLSSAQDGHCRQLALRDGDRFAGVAWERAASGAVFVRNAVAWLECSLHREVEAGDHAIALLRTHGMWYDASTEPLVFHCSQFRQLTFI